MFWTLKVFKESKVDNFTHLHGLYPSSILLSYDSYISSSTQNTCTSNRKNILPTVRCVNISVRYSEIHCFNFRPSIRREKARNLFNPGPTTKSWQKCKCILTFARILDQSNNTGSAWLLLVLLATGHLCVLVPSSGRGSSCSLVPAAAPARAPLPSYRRHTLQLPGASQIIE